MTTLAPPDPLTVEVVRNALQATTDEMSITLLRTAHSPIFSEGRDFSSAIYDRDGDALAQAQDCPIHLASIQFQLESCVAELGGAETLEDGDIFIANDPYLGGSHLPDVTVFQPIFYEGELVAYAANRAHHADVGGWSPGSFTAHAREVYQEGLRIPPVKLYSRGVPQEGTFRLILRNVRDADSMQGDLQAQVAALSYAADRLKNNLIPKFGLETILRCKEPILGNSEARMRDEIRAMPDGVYEAEDFVDDDGLGGGPYRIKVAVTISGDSAEVDFTGTAAMAPGPINAPFAVTAGAVYIAFLTATDPTIPTNGGCYRPIEIKVPQGSVLNPSPPAACAAGNTYTATRVIETVRKALAAAAPHRAAAGHGDHIQLLVGGYDPKTERNYQFYEIPVGGWGATANQDGDHAVFSLVGNCSLIPVEVFETKFPWRVDRMALRGGSGGIGRTCGGNGIVKDYVLLRGEARITLASDRKRYAPYGLDGGGDGSPARMTLIRGETERDLPSKVSDVTVEAGDVLSLHCSGGGGMGAP